MGRDPVTGAALASPPTLSRWENAVGPRSLYRMGRTLAATVTAYVAAFVLIVGSLGYGLLLPTNVDPNSRSVPAPPAVTYLSPMLALLTIATAQPPPQGYGVRSPGGQFQSSGSGCTTAPNGTTTCYSTGGFTSTGKGGTLQTTTTTIPSGLFAGWQYWQATVVMQLAVCLIALLASALRLPPVRRFPWRRARPHPAEATA